MSVLCVFVTAPPPPPPPKKKNSDCCVSYWCGCCDLIQQKNELETRIFQGEFVPNPTAYRINGNNTATTVVRFTYIITILFSPFVHYFPFTKFTSSLAHTASFSDGNPCPSCRIPNRISSDRKPSDGVPTNRKPSDGVPTNRKPSNRVPNNQKPSYRKPRSGAADNSSECFPKINRLSESTAPYPLQEKKRE